MLWVFRRELITRTFYKSKKKLQTTAKRNKILQLFNFYVGKCTRQKSLKILFRTLKFESYFVKNTCIHTNPICCNSNIKTRKRNVKKTQKKKRFKKIMEFSSDSEQVSVKKDICKIFCPSSRRQG